MGTDVFKGVGQNEAQHLSKKWRILMWCFMAISVALYCIYAYRQNADVFFESQFLHIEFLRQLVSSEFTAKGFFTTFGEHLFPGYNIILAANYYLFRIWGGFDTVVFAVALLTSAIFLAFRASAFARQTRAGGVGVIMILFTQLSVSVNPQWGMALSAAVGVTLFVVGSFFFSKVLISVSDRWAPLIAAGFFFVSIFIFSGGYAVGMIAAIFIAAFVKIILARSLDRGLGVILLAVVIALILYVSIVVQYGSIFSSRPRAETFDGALVLRFFLVMTGSSILGKAFFEQFGSYVIYYAAGLVLLLSFLAFLRIALRDRTLLSIWFLVLSSYSFFNIVVVSLFRYRNGLDGAMGQWYGVHTHFLILGPIYLAFFCHAPDLIRRRFALCFSLLFAICVLGYVADWRKAPYAAAYKMNFVSQVPTILNSPDSIDKANEFSTMLWNYQAVSSGLKFLRENGLWIFRNASDDKSPVSMSILNSVNVK